MHIRASRRATTRLVPLFFVTLFFGFEPVVFVFVQKVLNYVFDGLLVPLFGVLAVHAHIIVVLVLSPDVVFLYVGNRRMMSIVC